MYALTYFWQHIDQSDFEVIAVSYDHNKLEDLKEKLSKPCREYDELLKRLENEAKEGVLAYCKENWHALMDCNKNYSSDQAWKHCHPNYVEHKKQEIVNNLVRDYYLFSDMYVSSLLERYFFEELLTRPIPVFITRLPAPEPYYAANSWGSQGLNIIKVPII